MVLNVVPVQATVVSDYLDRFFETYPTEALAAGRHDFDSQLERLDPETRAEWVKFNQAIAVRISDELKASDLDFEEQLDLELLQREVQRQLFDYTVTRRPERDPLFWTRIIGNATLFLLVRDNQPLEHRLVAASARAKQVPELASEAMRALSSADPKLVSADLCTIAKRQAEGSARFYSEGFARSAGDGRAELQGQLSEAGAEAARSLGMLAEFLDELAGKASGSPRLGDDYANRFVLVTGVTTPVDQVLATAKEDFDAKISETADYGRSVWGQVMPDRVAPGEDRELVRALFERVGDDHAMNVDEFVNDYKDLVAKSIQMVREQDIVTLPDPLTLYTDRSPDFFVGQGVGGVYSAGPFEPEADTLFYLPTPSADASVEQLEGFFRDFNHHFNVMITPHEMVPGHYLQLKFAARHPHKVRALFGDGVYIEGWGTFCERLMLDLGWGGPLDRLAHLKKQLENIARTIVDIQVNTQMMSRDEVLSFVQDEAFQNLQFASNMWTRSITSSPQLTFYYQGYSQVRGLFDDVQKDRGESFVLKEFMDGMMELGPVPVVHYRARMLGDPEPVQGSK
jgi:uncharacterized protein (DUF885 family)